MPDNTDQPVQKKFRFGRSLTGLLLLLAGLIAGWLLGRPGSIDKEQASPAETNAASAKSVNLSVNQVQLSPEAIKNSQIEIGESVMRSFTQKLEVTGRLTYNEDNVARVGTFVGGRVTRLLARVGDFIKKGQPLIYLHSHELVDARGAEAKAKAMVTEKEKELAYAKAELERAERLLNAKAISKRELAHAAANVTTLAAQLQQAQAENERATEFLAHLTVPRDSPNNIVIYAPISGIVLKRNITLGTVVDEATDLMIMADLDTLWAIADVPEQQAATVRVGQTAEMRVPAYGEISFAARVTHIGEALKAETRTVQVRCLVNNPRGNLRPEMFAKILINSGPIQPAVCVPREAVYEVQGERVIFFPLDDGVFGQKAVQLGREQDGLVEIISGLEAGQRIVTRGGFFIKSELLKSTLSKE